MALIRMAPPQRLTAATLGPICLAAREKQGMLNHLGIRNRILVLALLPGTLLALVLGSYFTRTQLLDMQAQLQARGELIARQLAPLLAPPLQQDQPRKLQLILNDTLGLPDVRSVILLSPEHSLKAHAGPAMLAPPPPDNPQGASHITGPESTRFRIPLLGQHLYQEQEDSDGHSGARLLGWLELELSRDGTLLQSYRRLLTSLLLIGCCLLVSTWLALRLSRSISLPLRKVHQAVMQLKEGQLETRLPPLGGQELDTLASGINSMAEALFRGREELQQSIDQATEDVRHNLEIIEIQNIELDLARKEALEASRVKSEFLASISHELRTPLNSILGFTHLLQKSDQPPRHQDYLATIARSASNLLDIINEILDFSKIEAGRLGVETIPFNLRDTLEEALSLLAPAAHARQLELVCLTEPGTPLQLLGDPLRLTQIITNLVGNAIKFTDQGEIVVRTRAESGDRQQVRLRISVQDTGIGLSPQEIQTLFQPFSQAGSPLRQRMGGTGLGLAISRHLAEQMGGEIGVDSQPGTGSTFWISLPLDKAHDEAADRLAPVHGLAVLLEPRPLSRQALQLQLEALGLQVRSFDRLEPLEQAVLNSQSSEPVRCALLDLPAGSASQPELARRLHQLEQLGCQILLLCDPDSPPDSHLTQLTRPVSSRRLQALLAGPQQKQSGCLPARGPAPKILCVDDNPANLLLVETLLTDLGARPVAVCCGSDALAAIRQQAFELVFMDLQMPGMDGHQTTLALRQWEAGQPGQPHLPVVALTAHAPDAEKQRLLQEGFDDCLGKPTDERQLAQAILKWTGHHLHPALQPAGPAAPLDGHSPHPVLDADEGLRLAAGKAGLAREMLGMLLAGLPADRREIQQARSRGDHQTLLNHIHRLNGATRYCGVPQLRWACQQAETLLRQNDGPLQTALDTLDMAIVRLARETGVAL